jgi:hypothetical protein
MIIMGRAMGPASATDVMPPLCTRQAIAQAWRHVGHKRCGDPGPGSHLARAGTGLFCGAEPRIAIEVA